MERYEQRDIQTHVPYSFIVHRSFIHSSDTRPEGQVCTVLSAIPQKFLP